MPTEIGSWQLRSSSAYWAGEEELAKRSWRGGAGKEDDEEDEKEKEEEKRSVKI